MGAGEEVRREGGGRAGESILSVVFMRKERKAHGGEGLFKRKCFLFLLLVG